MRSNQISLPLAMRLVRFFNERPGSTVNKDRMYRRLWVMYPGVTHQTFNVPYDSYLTEAERTYRDAPMHTKRNPLKF